MIRNLKYCKKSTKNIIIVMKGYSLISGLKIETKKLAIKVHIAAGKFII